MSCVVVAAVALAAVASGAVADSVVADAAEVDLALPLPLALAQHCWEQSLHQRKQIAAPASVKHMKKRRRRAVFTAVAALSITACAGSGRTIPTQVCIAASTAACILVHRRCIHDRTGGRRNLAPCRLSCRLLFLYRPTL